MTFRVRARSRCKGLYLHVYNGWCVCVFLTLSDSVEHVILVNLLFV